MRLGPCELLINTTVRRFVKLTGISRRA
jgi:hypothetical protein